MVPGAPDKSRLPQSITIGSDLVYSAIHEFGGTIRVTPKMRAFLHYKGIHLKKTTTQITMPKRPYLRPGFDEAARGFEALLLKEWRSAVYGA